MTSIETFEALPLAAPLQRALREKNYETPSPIQAQAIPHLLDGADLMGVAQTGTGKTAAFALPLLHRMDTDRQRLKSNRFRTLVLTPTRELAEQVAQSFKDYGKHLKLGCATVYGGVSARPQIQALRRGTDTLVATPGRLLDLYEQGHINFDHVQYLVLDEADRMLDMGFLPDLRRIVNELPEARQSLFFSATLSGEIQKLAETILHEPVEVRIAPKVTTAEKIDHRMCFLQSEDKMGLLRHLLEVQTAKDGRNLTLVFSRTKHGADRLSRNLNRAGVRSDAIHGNKSQNARQRALESLRRGKVSVLVATDVAARGIDVKDITMVINYDLPVEPEAYVHRIGRTARAGTEGVAYSFCSPNELDELRAIQRLIKQAVPVLEEQPFHRAGLAERAATRGSHQQQTRKPAGRGGSRGPRGSRGPKRFGRGSGPGGKRGKAPVGAGTSGGTGSSRPAGGPNGVRRRRRA
ncbi:MAG: DEAD/DEAH box helicase [Opitutales bacterium]